MIELGRDEMEDLKETLEKAGLLTNKTQDKAIEEAIWYASNAYSLTMNDPYRVIWKWCSF